MAHNAKKTVNKSSTLKDSNSKSKVFSYDNSCILQLTLTFNYKYDTILKNNDAEIWRRVKTRI